MKPKREPGYYWVKIKNDKEERGWVPGRFQQHVLKKYNGSFYWKTFDDYQVFSEDELEVGQMIELPLEEKPVLNPKQATLFDHPEVKEVQL